MVIGKAETTGWKGYKTYNKGTVNKDSGSRKDTKKGDNAAQLSAPPPSTKLTVGNVTVNVTIAAPHPSEVAHETYAEVDHQDDDASMFSGNGHRSPTNPHLSDDDPDVPKVSRSNSQSKSIDHDQDVVIPSDSEWNDGRVSDVGTHSVTCLTGTKKGKAEMKKAATKRGDRSVVPVSETLILEGRTDTVGKHGRSPDSAARTPNKKRSFETFFKLTPGGSDNAGGIGDVLPDSDLLTVRDQEGRSLEYDGALDYVYTAEGNRFFSKIENSRKERRRRKVSSRTRRPRFRICEDTTAGSVHFLKS